VVGAVVGALVTIGIVALLGGFDSDDDGRQVANTTAPPTRQAPSLPTTTASPGTRGAPPQIVGFGVATTAAAGLYVLHHQARAQRERRRESGRRGRREM